MAISAEDRRKNLELAKVLREEQTRKAALSTEERETERRHEQAVKHFLWPWTGREDEEAMESTR